MSSQIWCRKIFPLPIKGGGGVGTQKKLLKMMWNTFWFWNFWDPIIFGGHGGGGGRVHEKVNIQPTNQTYGHYGD